MINTSEKLFLDQKRVLKFLTFLILAFSLALAFRGLLTGYSYWLDELHSVISSSGSWQYLYKKAIVNDVHPPLYQILLKSWILMVGSNDEVPVRLLSFVFATLTLLAFGAKSLTESSFNRVLALALLGFSPMFSYYSQEVRSYSLVLLLSTIVTLCLVQYKSLLRNGSKNQAPHYRTLEFVFYFGCLALSLTHYFGWIYVFSILLLRAFLNEISGDRIKSLLMLALISAWPVWHILFGGLGGSAGGDFWIKVSPPILGTLNMYLQGCLPFLAFSGPPYTVISSWTLLISFVLISVGSWRKLIQFFKQTRSPIVDESRFLLCIIASMLLMVSLVDLRLPMSTVRNFIVLLPPTMILLSNLLILLAGSCGWTNLRSATSYLIAVVILALLLTKSYRSLGEKIFPAENWQQLSAYVRASGVCTDGCTVMGSYGLHSYYFAGINRLTYKESSDLSTVLVDNAAKNQDYSRDSKQSDLRFPLLGFHNESENISKYLESHPDLICLQPSQGSANQTFILIPGRLLSGSENKFGMSKCQ